MAQGIGSSDSCAAELRVKRSRAARKVKLRIGAAVDAGAEPLAEHRIDGFAFRGLAAEQSLGGQKAPEFVAGGFGPVFAARLRDVERARSTRRRTRGRTRRPR